MSEELDQQNNPGLSSTPKEDPILTVVGIGASAGGLAALKRLFARMAPDTGLVFVVVVHLSPDHESHLVDLLQPSVRFPVLQVTDTTPLEPNTVYVIPPNANLSAIDTHLRLTKLEENRRERAPIDHFFRTLATSHDGHAMGVILTGTGSDGTLGLKEIKAKGGFILVQDPNEAEYDGMPQSAISTGLVDRILPLEEISEEMVRLAKVAPSVALPRHDASEADEARHLLPKVLAVLKARTDRDFSRYKSATLLRRIARRMQLSYIEDPRAYLEKLRVDEREVRLLADDVLVTVTSFFRDANVFESLEKTVIPLLFENKSSDDTLRVWSVGCASGEEAYSLAMLFLEEAARRETPPKLQIFASDLHKRSLDGAREGIFSGDIAVDVHPERLERFFRKENGGYRINKDVREIVTFAPHNLLGDPPFSRLHLIACRNLLIYLDRSAQSDVVDLFHYALCPDGYLLLGSAETLDSSELFRTEDKKLCLYRKRNVPPPEPRLPVFPLTRLRGMEGTELKQIATPGPIAYRALHHNLIEQLALPSILVAPDDRVAHLSTTAGRYLVLPGGDATLHALKVIREELRIELQRLLQISRETREVQDSAPVAVRFNGHAAPVVMHVYPAQLKDQEGFVLVVFEEHQRLRDSAPGEETESLEPGEAAARVREVEAELFAARQRLQVTVEENEASQEEMKASVEEMQSTNEELRSTMEELETSKEELQSINEELQTVNQENRHKVEELSQLSSDLQNLLAATDIATLFLDRKLRIMRFTPKLAELFNVMVTDRGRRISDLTNRLGYPQLMQDAESVLNRLIPIDREIRDDDGKWFLARVLPYRTTEDRIQGVVITFIDISVQKRAEIEIRASKERQEFLLSLSDELRALVDPEAVQARAARLLGLRLEADRVFYAQVEQNDLVTISTEYCSEGVASVTGRHRLGDFGHAAKWMLASGRTVVHDDMEAVESLSPDERSANQRFAIAAAVKVPLIKSGRMLAFFAVHQTRPRAWQETEVALVEAAAERTWASVERARVEAALRDSEARYRTLFDSIDEGFCIAEAVENPAGNAVDYRFLEVNRAFERVTGLRSVEGRLVSEVAPGVERSWIESSDRDRSRSGDPARIEHFNQETGRWYQAYSSPIDSAGNHIGVVFHDISSRKRGEANLAVLAEVSEDLANLTEVEATMNAVSARICRHFRAPLCAFFEFGSGKDSAAVWHSGKLKGMPEPPDEHLRSFFHSASFRRACRAGQAVVVGDAASDQRMDAEHAAALSARAFVCVPHLREDECIFALAVFDSAPRAWRTDEVELCKDITGHVWTRLERARAEQALSESEERVRLLVENVMEYAIFQTDRANLVTSWNPGAERLFGYSSADMLGRDVSCLVSQEDRASGLLRQEVEQVLTGGRQNNARWLYRKDGSRFWAQWVTEPVRDEEGHVRGVARILRDETDRQLAEEASRRSLVEKEELLKEVHHRVKNNLQVITSLINLRARQVDDPRMLELFEETRNRVYSVSAIHELIYRSSSFAEIDMAEYAGHLVPSLLRFYGVEDRVRLKLEGEGARLELERAVPFGLLLNELASNVCKHAFPNGERGDLTVHVEQQDGFAVLEVADTGSGLPAGFDYRASGSLGLELVHNLARQLRATVEILDGPGTRVRVQIPERGPKEDP